MTLGEVTKTENSLKPTFKTKIFIFLKKMKKIFWIIIILIVAFQAYLIITNFFNKSPDLKMCFDRSTCVGYCPVDSQKECYDLVTKDNQDKEYNLDLLLRGKINIIEFFSKNPKYCYCNNSTDKSSQEELYNFYNKNK